jgi:hypothetical protein
MIVSRRVPTMQMEWSTSQRTIRGECRAIGDRFAWSKPARRNESFDGDRRHHLSRLGGTVP